MEPHKYRVGQIVHFVELSRASGPGGISAGSFRVVGLLPDHLGHNQYRLQSTGDGHQRVVVENEIAPQ